MSDEEHALLGSAHATATNAALRSLARAARSFLIYDAHNEAIRAFLRDYRSSVDAALALGPLELEVRPFELVQHTSHGEETVYVQRDRDKSLAFRLYRDGVRRLTVQPEVDWGELLRLLEILSIRYTGVRQHEDDIVTLLWKAGFDHIEIVAVEGFVLAGGADETEGEADSASAREARRAGPKAEVPSDWDRPLPPHPHGHPTQLGYRPIPPAATAAAQHEVSSRAVGRLAVRLCRDMLELVRDPTDPTRLSEVAGLVDEVRTLLQADGQLDQLLALAHSVAALRHLDEEAGSTALRRFVDARALARILHSAARSKGDVPPELLRLLDLIPGDHLPDLLTAMREERSTGSRALARQLIEREVERRPASVLHHIGTTEPEIGGDLLRALGQSAPELAVKAATSIVENPAPELQGEILRLVRGLDAATLPPPTVVDWLRSPSEDLRLAAIQRVGRTGEASLYMALKHHLEQLPGRAVTEAAAVGVAMATLAPKRALQELGNWVRPRSLLDRMRGAASTGLDAYAGVSGLAALPGEYPETAIRWRMERSGEALRHHCQRALFERRQSGVQVAHARLAEAPVHYHSGMLSHPGTLVLTEEMLCFAPSRDWERWLGAAQLDLALRSLDRVELDKGKNLVVHSTDGEHWRFSGSGAIEVGEVLQRHLDHTTPATPGES